MRHFPLKTSTNRGGIADAPGVSAATVWRWLVFALVAAVFVWACVFGSRLAQAEWLSMEPRHRIAQWTQGGQPWQMKQWAQMQGQLRQALRITPDNPVLHDNLASLYALRGQSYWTTQSLRRAFFLDARRHQVTSLQLRAVNGRTWAALALSMHALGEPPANVYGALGNARKFSPSDPKVQRMVASLVLAHWGTASPEWRQWTLGLYQQPDVRMRLGLETMFKTYGVAVPALL